MVGRWIDRVVLTVVGTAGLYLFLLNAGFGIPLSAVLAFAGVTLAGYLYRNRPWRDRVTAAQARAALTAIAMLPEVEALGALQRLTGRDDIVPVIRHPGAALSAGEVFGLWRAHMGEEALTLAATCLADPEAAALAETLDRPRCTLIDSPALCDAIRATGLYVPSEPLRVPHLRGFLSRVRRPAGPGAMLYGASLLGMYLLTGRPLCLLCGLALIGATGASLIRRFS